MSQNNNDLQTILNRYIAGPEHLESELQDLNNEQLDLSLSAGSWSIRQLVHHITDGDYLWKEFLLQATGDPEKEFSLEWYWCLPQDDWVKRWSYAERDVGHSLALLKANRQHTMDILKQVPIIWEKSLSIPTPNGGREKVSVGEVVEMQSRHVEGHIEDIRQIRQFHQV